MILGVLGVAKLDANHTSALIEWHNKKEMKSVQIICVDGQEKLVVLLKKRENALRFHELFANINLFVSQNIERCSQKLGCCIVLFRFLLVHGFNTASAC